MSFLRLLLVAVLFVGFAGLPLGCGGNGEEPPTPPKPPTEKEVKEKVGDVEGSAKEELEKAKEGSAKK